MNLSTQDLLASPAPYQLANPAPSLALAGQCGYRIDSHHGHVVINVEEIANLRDGSNLSGSLALELWALAQPYQGQDFSGVALAATQIGGICGQYCLRNCQYQLQFQQPPAGNWILVLMLREWQDGAFVTRDYINFSAPFLVDESPISAAKTAVSRSDKGNVIELDFGDQASRNAADKPAAAADNRAKPAATPETASDAATPDAPAAALHNEAVAVEQKQPAKSKRKTALKAARQTQTSQVSVNSASFAEVHAVKGVSKKLAQCIVDSRPFKSLEDLLKVKGMGKKLLKKLESQIKL